ncbi:uncharacterized protein LOC143445693 isoform X1 [Clavelina lepadiformis]|uniref:uncharacterized protein LOC143445693 isoform X1 n=1 Tax=Clavelina lepadiformis TaxID=159417 RepID=UPI004041B071
MDRVKLKTNKKVNEKTSIRKLQEELSHVKETFKQVIEENTSESYDLRRTSILKAQVVQLERQCMLLSQALSCKASVMLDTETMITDLIKEFQKLLVQETHGPDVFMSRKNLMSHIEAMQRVRAGFHKYSDLADPETLHVPIISGSKFSKLESLSCLDLCTNKKTYLNLCQVAYLEDKLCTLFKQLTSLQETLKMVTILPKLENDEVAKSPLSERYLYRDLFQKTQKDIGTCKKNVEECCNDLLALSLLHPSAPWHGVQNTSNFGVFDSQKLLSNMQGKLGSTRNEVKAMVKGMCRAHNYLLHMHSLQLRAVKEEVHFYAETKRLHTHQINLLWQGITRAYDECESHIKNSISKPIANILQSWKKVRLLQTEAAHTEFITAITENELALEIVADKTINQSSGSQDLSEFGLQMQKQIDLLQQQYAKEVEEINNKIASCQEKNETEIVTILNSLHLK